MQVSREPRGVVGEQRVRVEAGRRHGGTTEKKCRGEVGEVQCAVVIFLADKTKLRIYMYTIILILLLVQ
jgi:hypothetical protein